MRAVIPPMWLAFTERFEGGVAYLYNDLAGGTTIAYGNLVNSPGAVAALPLVRRSDGAPATTAEKIAAFHAVHNDPHAASAGHLYAKRLTSLELTREAMSDLALARLHSNDRELVAQLPDFEAFPACAQLALHSWAWACGARAHFPRMMAALRERDFDQAAVEIFMDEDLRGPDGAYLIRDGKRVKNAGLVPRNIANRILMRNAARVQAFGLDPDMLNWKVDLSVAEVETQPELPTFEHEDPRYVEEKPASEG